MTMTMFIQPTQTMSESDRRLHRKKIKHTQKKTQSKTKTTEMAFQYVSNLQQKR